MAWFVVLLLWCSPAWAENVHDRAVAALQGYERIPGAKFWKNLGEDGRSALVKIYEDGNQPRHVRHRAVTALRHYPDAVSRRTLRSIIATSEMDLMVREALMSLDVAFGSSEHGVISSALAHTSVAVRETSFRCLRGHGTDRAWSAIRARAKVESRLWLKRAMLKSLPR